MTIKAHLDVEKPLNTAIYACLMMCFYASVKLGEFTAWTLGVMFKLNALLDLSWEAATKVFSSLVLELLLQVLG